MYEMIVQQAPKVSEILGILSHEKRLAMLCILSEGEHNISSLTQKLGISQSLASQFALKMRQQGILESRKEGKEVFYAIHDQKILTLLETLKNTYCRL